MGPTGTVRWILADASDSGEMIAGRNESDGSARLTRRTGGSDTHTNTSNTMSAGSWHFISYRLAATNDAEVMLDMNTGSKASSSATVAPSGLDRYSMGKRDNSLNTNPFDGQIALNAVWNADLSDEELQAIYEGAHPLEIQPENLVRLYDNFGRTSGFVYDEIGDAHLAINGTSVSTRHPDKLNHYIDLAGAYGPPAVAPVTKSVELRVSIGDTYETVSVPLTRRLTEIYFELTDSNIRIAESGGSDTSATPSGALNAQTGSLVLGSSNAYVSDLVLLPSADSKEGYERIFARRLAPTARTTSLKATSGRVTTFDLAALFDDRTLGITFTEVIAADDGTTATIDGTTLTVVNAKEVSDTLTLTASNLHPAYPETVEIEIGVTFEAGTVDPDDPDSGAAFANGYAFRKEILVAKRLDGTETATDFVLLVRFDSDDDLRTVANSGNVQSSVGWDIIFTDDNDTQLDHELESYSPTTGELTAWVRLPSWSFGADYRLRIYYGRSGLEAATENPIGTWQSEAYAWRLEDGTDRRGGLNDLTNTNVTSGTLIEDAGAFDGTARYSGQLVPSPAGLETLTVRGMLKADEAAIGTSEGIFGFGPITGVDDEQMFGLRFQPTGVFGADSVWAAYAALESGTEYFESEANSQTTDETYFAFVFDTPSLSLWLNDRFSPASFSASGGSGGLRDIEGNFYIGAASQDGTSGGINATIDQLTISSSALSPQWLSAERDSWHYRGTFLGVGAENEPGVDFGPVASPLFAETVQDTAITFNPFNVQVSPESVQLSVDDSSKYIGLVLTGSPPMPMGP